MSETLAIPFDVTAVTQDELVSLGLKGSYISHRNSIPEAVLVIEKEEVHRVPVSAFYARAFHAFSYKFELLKFTIAKLPSTSHEAKPIAFRLLQTLWYMDRVRDSFFEEMSNSGSGRSPAFDYYLWLDWLCKVHSWSEWSSSEHDDGIRRKAEQQCGVTFQSVTSGVKRIEDVVNWEVYQESQIEAVDSCGFGYRLRPIGREIPDASKWCDAIVAKLASYTSIQNATNGDERLGEHILPTRGNAFTISDRLHSYGKINPCPESKQRRHDPHFHTEFCNALISRAVKHNTSTLDCIPRITTSEPLTEVLCDQREAILRPVQPTSTKAECLSSAQTSKIEDGVFTPAYFEHHPFFRLWDEVKGKQ